MAVAPRASAVSFYPTEHPALSITVKSHLEKMLREGQENLAEGYASDWADYRYRCGVMHGLRLAIGTCEDVFKQMSER